MNIACRREMTLALIVAVNLSIQVVANGIGYWEPTENWFPAPSKETWTKKEIDRLLDVALPGHGPTDPKVAALEELVTAVAHESELPDGFEEAILKILPRPEAGITVPTAKIVGMLKLEAARDELESWATGSDAGWGVEALKALVSLGGEKTYSFLRAQYDRNCEPPGIPFDAEGDVNLGRRRANILCALIEHDVRRATPDLINHFSIFPGDQDNEEIFKMILAQRDGSGTFARALAGRRLPATVVEIGMAVVGDSGRPHEELTEALEKAAEQGGADQPAITPELKPEGNEKPKPESEVRPQ